MSQEADGTSVEHSEVLKHAHMNSKSTSESPGGNLTPLFIAVTQKHLESAALLLAHGADPGEKTPSGCRDSACTGSVLHSMAANGLLAPLIHLVWLQGFSLSVSRSPWMHNRTDNADGRPRQVNRGAILQDRNTAMVTDSQGRTGERVGLFALEWPEG